MVVDRQNVFDGTVNYNVLNIDGTVESLNLPLYAPETCPTDSERNDRIRSKTGFGIYCNCSAGKSRISERLDSRTNIFATERFAVWHAYK